MSKQIIAAHLPAIQAARSHARARTWAAGAAPDHDGWLHLDVDATITIDHSDNKENTTATWKHTFGFHPLLVFLDRTDIAAGEGLRRDCCVRAMPAATPPPITSPCWVRHCRRCRRPTSPRPP